MKIFILLLLTFPIVVIAQQGNPATEKDSVLVLPPVLIKGFESGRSLLETPVAVGLVTGKDMQRYSNASLLPSVNTLSGVRMEERSPGSYRLNIRGSLLRSPFGVRNIKVYWNDMPFTDAGGNTYLNLVDPNTISAIEVLKGPGEAYMEPIPVAWLYCIRMSYRFRPRIMLQKIIVFACN